MDFFNVYFCLTLCKLLNIFSTKFVGFFFINAKKKMKKDYEKHFFRIFYNRKYKFLLGLQIIDSYINFYLCIFIAIKNRM